MADHSTLAKGDDIKITFH